MRRRMPTLHVTFKQRKTLYFGQRQCHQVPSKQQLLFEHRVTPHKPRLLNLFRSHKCMLQIFWMIPRWLRLFFLVAVYHTFASFFFFFHTARGFDSMARFEPYEKAKVSSPRVKTSIQAIRMNTPVWLNKSHLSSYCNCFVADQRHNGCLVLLHEGVDMLC